MGSGADASAPKSPVVRSKWGSVPRVDSATLTLDDDFDSLKKEVGKRNGSELRLAIWPVLVASVVLAYLIFNGITPEQLKGRLLQAGVQASQLKLNGNVGGDFFHFDGSRLVLGPKGGGQQGKEEAEVESGSSSSGIGSREGKSKGPNAAAVEEEEAKKGVEKKKTAAADEGEQQQVEEEEAWRKKKDKGIHVFISTDETDLRPIAVVINSTMMNAKNPERVDFHLVIPEENVAAAKEKLLPLFPKVPIDINRQKVQTDRIKKLIQYKEGSGARKELVSVFNFLPFYLPLMAQDFERIVYLDADTAVVGDIAQLSDVDMEGKAGAAVEDCMQTFKTYFDFKQLAQIQASKEEGKPWMPSFLYDKKACVFNRGVLLMDVKKWIEQNMTGSIEWWMDKFIHSKEPLYKFGLSQPPFLLTMYERYKKLDRCWNTRGLGRDKFGEKERDYFARIGFGRPAKEPFLSPWADEAKILHFNGAYKPWRAPRERPEGEKPKALCGEKKIDCATLWWKYISPKAEKILRPAQEEAGEDKE